MNPNGMAVVIERSAVVLDRERVIEIIAGAAHTANVAYCCGIGDHGSRTPWKHESQELRASVLSGVNVALGGATPEQCHEGWVARKRAEGWKYGPVKDADAKTHPCMLSYGDLPPEQKLKDELFTNMVRELAPLFGLEVADR